MKRRGDVRNKIVEAAMQVFAERGFFNATTDEVARAAGVSKGLIFWYFRRKDDLIKEVAKRSLPLDIISECLCSGLKGRQLLRRIAEEYVRKYSCDTNRSLLFQALSIRSTHPTIGKEISEVCSTLLDRVAEEVYGSVDLDKRVRMRIFFGALLCYALSGVEEVNRDFYISKVIEIVM
ncbi:MAG: TetR/AcrR family transcriptional regulator [Thermoprotei archaeon]|nr:TetR/AcrR family transcriptional regulator [Thermoprotei archaeon]